MGFLDRVLRGEIGEQEEEHAPTALPPTDGLPDEIVVDGGGADMIVVDPSTTN